MKKYLLPSMIVTKITKLKLELIYSSKWHLSNIIEMLLADVDMFSLNTRDVWVLESGKRELMKSEIKLSIALIDINIAWRLYQKSNPKHNGYLNRGITLQELKAPSYIRYNRQKGEAANKVMSVLNKVFALVEE